MTMVPTTKRKMFPETMKASEEWKKRDKAWKKSMEKTAKKLSIKKGKGRQFFK